MFNYNFVLVILCLMLSIYAFAEGQSSFKQPFFKQAKSIVMADKLAVALGAMDEGAHLVYNYEDAVKLAGHSCLAVSSAYRLTQIALERLFSNEIPVRGEIEVMFMGGVDYKVNGPISQVVTLITGAAAENGFKGFSEKKFRRYNLLHFDKTRLPPAGATCSVIFSRIDNGKSVEVSFTNNTIPKKSDMQEMVRVVLFGKVEEMFVINNLLGKNAASMLP